MNILGLRQHEMGFNYYIIQMLFSHWAMLGRCLRLAFKDLRQIPCLEFADLRAYLLPSDTLLWLLFKLVVYPLTDGHNALIDLLTSLVRFDNVKQAVQRYN